MRLSKKELLRAAARHARKLAYECVAGTAPLLIARHLSDDTGHYCVAGLLGQRLRGNEFAFRDLASDNTTVEAYMLLIDANNDAAPDERHGAVVFPLLALADALEEAAKSRGRASKAVLEEL